MNWYYAQGGNQLGPVSQEEFDALVAAGTITGTTLVWRDGMTNWQPWETLQPPVTTASAEDVLPAPPAATTGPAASGRVRCRECGGDFAEEDTIRFGDARVCAACKPVFLQRLAEGAALAAAGAGQAGPDEVLRRDYRIDLGRCVERGWKLFQENIGLMVGAGAIALGLMLVLQVMLQVLGFIIPLGGVFVGPFVVGPLMGGATLLCLVRIRNQPADVSLVFSGYRLQWLQLALQQLIQTVLLGVCMIPLFIVAVGFGVSVRGIGGGGPPTATTMMGLSGLMLLTILLALLAFVYLSVSWIFSVPLIIDKGCKFWPAMELSRKVVAKHFWQCLLMVIVTAAILMVGAMFCLVGLIVTAPLSMIVYCYSYEDLFGDMVSQ